MFFQQMPSHKVLSLCERYARDREEYRQRNERLGVFTHSSQKRVSSSGDVPGWDVIDVGNELENTYSHGHSGKEISTQGCDTSELFPSTLDE